MLQFATVLILQNFAESQPGSPDETMAGQEGAQIQRAPPRRRMAGQRRIFLSGQMQQQYCRREYAEPPVGSESGAFLGPEEVGVRGAHGLVG